MQVIAQRFFDVSTMKFPSLRSLGALILLMVFVWGQFALLPTVVMRVASMSGEHELMILDQKVVLHHAASPRAEHHGWTQWLVAMSQTDDTGDHVLPLGAPDRCDESRDPSIPEKLGPMIVVSRSGERSNHLTSLLSYFRRVLMDQHRTTEMVMAQWSTIRLII